jgi:hypothetical protein
LRITSYYSKCAFLLFLSILATGVAVPRPAGADASNPALTLAVGDSWTYGFTTNLVDFTLAGTLTMTIVQKTPIDVAGISYDSFLMGVSGSGTVFGSIMSSGLNVMISGSWTASGDDYQRVSDQAEIKSHVAFQIIGQASAGAISRTFSETEISDSQNSPPKQSLQFPIYVGAHWVTTTTVTQNATSYGTFSPTPILNVTTTTRSHTYDVSSNQVLSVDAGSFDTYLVKTRAFEVSTLVGSADNYYSPQAENLVKSVAYNATGYPTTTLTLSAYNAWPYKTNVGITVNGKIYTPVVESDVPTSSLIIDSRSITFQVSGTDGITGRAQIWIPKGLNNTVITASIDGKTLAASITQNATQYQVRMTFPLSTHTIILTYNVNPSFSSFLRQNWLPLAAGALGIIVILVLALFIVTRRKPPAPSPLPEGSPPPSDQPPPQAAPPLNEPPPSPTAP